MLTKEWLWISRFIFFSLAGSEQVIVEIPYVLLQSACYSVIIYGMMSFQWTTAKFFWFFFITFVSLLYFTYYGMMTVALTPNLQAAAIFASAFFGFFTLFSGFFIPKPVRPQIPISNYRHGSRAECRI